MKPPPTPDPSVPDPLPWWWETPDSPIPNDPDNVRYIARKQWRAAQAEAQATADAEKAAADAVKADEVRARASVEAAKTAVKADVAKDRA